MAGGRASGLHLWARLPAPVGAAAEFAWASPRPCARPPAAGLWSGWGCPQSGPDMLALQTPWSPPALARENPGLPEGPPSRAAGAPGLARGHPFMGADPPGVCGDSSGLWLRPSGASAEYGWGSRAGAPSQRGHPATAGPEHLGAGSGWPRSGSGSLAAVNEMRLVGWWPQLPLLSDGCIGGGHSPFGTSRAAGLESGLAVWSVGNGLGPGREKAPAWGVGAGLCWRGGGGSWRASRVAQLATGKTRASIWAWFCRGPWECPGRSWPQLGWASALSRRGPGQAPVAGPCLSGEGRMWRGWPWLRP